MGFAWILTMLGAVIPGWVVVEPVANMYSRPSQHADVVSQATYATSVDGLEQRDGWMRIRTPDDYTGWMPLSFLRQQGASRYPANGRVAVVRSLFANLYHEPDHSRRQPLLTVPFETGLEVIDEPGEENQRWIHIRLPDERTAWLRRGDVSIETADLGIAEAIALSRRFVGLPYLWGGTSSFGYDCSGFTQMLCRRRGVAIPRDSGPQARWEGFEAINRDELQPGDLVFFGKSEAEVTHTGMYIGDGEFIHATAYLRPAVQISRLDNPHWAELLVACRRLR